MMEEKNLEQLLREIQELCGEDDDLVNRYRTYSKVDAEKALEEMRQRINGHKEVPFWHRYRYGIAAAIAALIVGGLFWYWQYAKVIPPVIPENIQQAMARSEQQGFLKAEVEEVNINTKELFADHKENTGKNLQKESSERMAEAEAAEEALMEARRVTTRHDKEFWMTLPDGSVVHLNNNTRVVYPERFTGDTRDIFMEGEAYLMVAKDKRHPFVVHTPDATIHVHGTEFCVNTRDADNTRTSVVLVSNKISVTSKDGKSVEMNPGDMALIYPEQPEPKVTRADVTPYVAWNTGTFVFEDCTLMRLMSVVSKWYGYQVTFKNQEARTKRFTGELDKYGDIEPMIDAIEQVTGLTIKLHENKMDIY